MARLGLLMGLLAVMLTGCSLNAWQSELNQSLATWQRLKAENGGYYRYEMSFASWAGSGNMTTLTVRNDKVIARAYEAYQQGDAVGEIDITESWTEEGVEVGSHDSGADPITVDTLYDRCRSDVLTQSTLANEIYLGFHTSGVLETCTYRPLDCMDDCSRGVTVDRLEFLSDKD